MSKLPHFLIENSSYFLTSTTYNRKPIFHNDHYAQILCNIIYNLRKREKMSLLGFVIMPEHFHLLIIPAKGIEIPWIMQEIKKGSARLINMERFGRAQRGAQSWYSGSSSTSRQNPNPEDVFDPERVLSGSETSPTPVCFTTPGNNPIRYSGSSQTPKKISTPKKVSSLTSRKVWMDEYFDYVIRSEEDLIKHLKYIHNNPIKRGVVETPEKYTWSSANPNFENDLEKVLSGSEI